MIQPAGRETLRWSDFRLKSAGDSVNSSEHGLGVCSEDLPMSNEYLPYSEKQDVISAADDAASTGAFGRLSPQLLEEFDDDESPSDEVLMLLEENARLRALAVELSNLVGNLSDREWDAALTPAEDRRKPGT
ncbi:hypothetical protein Q3C01_27615 [Bradyrhizobium sp. UFLA05-109]